MPRSGAERAVGLPPAVQEAIRPLHPELKREVRAALEVLRASPERGKALKAELEGWRSHRVRGLGIVYRSSAASIDVAAIGPRSSIYFEMARLIRARRR
jgi:hypothetical protein